MQTVTSKPVRHSLPKIVKMLKKGPLHVTQRGTPIFEIHPPFGRWTPPDFTARARKNTGNKYRNVSLFDGTER